MKNTSQLFDKLAVAWAFVCAIHCVALPMILAVFPSVFASAVDDHAFHRLMLALVIPSSVIAVLLGCWQHKDTKVCILASSGMLLLAATHLFGHLTLGELGEKLAMLGASFLLVIAHWRNYQLCNADKCHDC